MISCLDFIEKNKIIPINLIKNKHIDYSKNKLKIDIIILIYFYGIKGQRYYFQSFIFDYFIKLKNIFSNYIDFSFTIVGSEKDLSKKLSNKYFKESEYYEFYQDPKLNILKMLSKKINYGFRQSYKKNTDLLLWFGSNDYVCANYFINILEKYNNGFQQYGMTDYFNGNNFCLYLELEQLILNVDSMYIHNGIHDYCKREKYKYIAATHGYSRKLLNKFPEILDKISCDEGANEYLVTKLNEKYPKLNINSMKTNNCFFFNIKFGNEELHSFKKLKKFNKKNIIELNNFKDNDTNKNYQIFLNNLKYIQNHNLLFYNKEIYKDLNLSHQINLNKKINKYNIIIKIYEENLHILKKFKNIEDDLIGRNSRMDTIQAAVLDVKLESLEYNNELRRKNAQLYTENLKDISNIKLPVIENNSLPVFHLFVIMIEHRDELQEYLKSKGIVTLIHYPISIAETDAYKNIKFENIDNCINNSKKILSLPMYPELEEEEILYVCKNINYFFLENNLLKIKSINVNNKSGILNCINHLDFDMKRFFYIDQFNDLSSRRGFHSNENCDEILFIIKGSINLKLINKKNESIEKKISKDEYYFIKSNTWLEFEILEKDTNIIVLANETLSKTKSIFDFDEFLNN